MTTTNRAIAHGAAWMLLARFTERSLGFVSTLVLARLLVPEDFGLVAMAMSILALLELLTNFSLDIALVQHAAPTRQHYDTVWTIRIIFKFAMACLLVILAYPVAWFYDESRVAPMMFVLALVAILGAFVNVGIVQFRRDLQFAAEFRLTLYRRLVTVPITIALAFLLRDHWALVLGTLFGTGVGVALSYLMHPFRPRFSLVCARELFGFSKWLFLNNLFIFVSTRAGDLIIGRLRGPTELGLFNMANEIASLPPVEIVAPINRAAFSGYSKLARETNGLTATFLKVFGMIALVVCPFGIGLALTAHLFVPLVLGARWMSTIPLIETLSLAAVLFALCTNTLYVFMALGKPDRVAQLSALQAFLTVCALIGFLNWKLPNGAGWAMLSVSAAMTLPNMYLLRRELSIKVTAFATILWRPITATATMALVVASVEATFSKPVATIEHLWLLLAVVPMGAIAYIATTLALWWATGRPDGPERAALELLGTKWQEFRAMRRSQ